MRKNEEAHEETKATSTLLSALVRDSRCRGEWGGWFEFLVGGASVKVWRQQERIEKRKSEVTDY